MDLNSNAPAAPAARPLQRFEPSAATVRRPAPPVQATIDTLVLRGFPTLSTARVHEAVVTHLDALIAAARLADHHWSPQTTPRVDGLRVKINGQPTPETIGHEIARAVFSQITGGREAAP